METLVPPSPFVHLGPYFHGSEMAHTISTLTFWYFPTMKLTLAVWVVLCAQCCTQKAANFGGSWVLDLS